MQDEVYNVEGKKQGWKEAKYQSSNMATLSQVIAAHTNKNIN